MNPERWARCLDILEAVEENGATLDELTAGDDLLRRDLEVLLARQTNHGDDFLEVPVASLGSRHLYSPERQTFDAGQRIAERWTIEEMVGKGGMGEVYRAFDNELGEQIALKTVRRGIIDFDSAAEDRFRSEIRIARKIGHANVCKVYDIFTHHADGGEQIRFVTMEFAAGKTLAAALECEGPLPAVRALNIARQMISGLGAAHNKGVIHADFKSSNLILSPSDSGDHVLILDFGLARISLADETSQSGESGGTPGYMAPEQWSDNDLTFATDIYALGAVLYEMVTGLQPFGNGLTPSLLHRQKRAEIPSLRLLRPDIDPRWVRAITRCLDPDPARRFQRAEDVWNTLNAKPFWKKTEALIGMGGLAALTGVLSFWLPSQKHTRDPATSFAVMPFDAADNGDSARLASGLSDELIGALSRVRGIRVMARETVAQYGSRPDPARVGRELGVNRVIRGALSTAGQEIEISVEVVRPAEGSVVWAQKFHRPASEAVTLFHEVDSAIVGEVQPTSPVVRHGVTHTPSPDVYRSYLDARYLLNYRTLDPRNGERAARKFEETVASDPDYSDAWAGLIDAYSVAGRPQRMTQAEFNNALRNAATRALALDPSSPETLAASATILQHLDYDWALAEKYLRRAIQIQPGNAGVHLKLGGLLSDTGRVNESMREYDAALDLDRLSPSIRNSKAICLIDGRRYEEARDLIESNLEAPQGFRLYPYLGAIYLFAGRKELALEQYKKGRDMARGDSISTAHLAWALAKTGQPSQAESLLRTLVARPGGADAPFFVAAAYSAIGKNEQALEWLNRALADRDWDLTQLKVHPYFDDLRDDSRFHAILKRINLE